MNMTLENAFNIRDEFCCLELLQSIVTSGDLKDSTSSIYKYLYQEPELKLVLLNILYIPHSIFAYAKSDVLSDLLQNATKYVSKEQLESSTAIMSDTYAMHLVMSTADENAQELMPVIIGKAAYRCAFSNLDEFSDLNEIQFKVTDEFLTDAESNKLVLLIQKIAMHQDIRNKINTTNDFDKLTEELMAITLDDFASITEKTAKTLARLILDKDKSNLIDFLGQNIYGVTW